jgi:hypothetical protein
MSLSTKQSVQLTQLPIPVTHLWWSSTGRIFFAAAVFPRPSEQLEPIPEEVQAGFDAITYTGRAETAIKESDVHCRVYTDLPVRNWDGWIDERVSHVFELPVHHSADGSVAVAGMSM